MNEAAYRETNDDILSQSSVALQENALRGAKNLLVECGCFSRSWATGISRRIRNAQRPGDGRPVVAMH
jgi:hypothetical protein